jgi:hypothetical protein
VEAVGQLISHRLAAQAAILVSIGLSSLVLSPGVASARDVNRASCPNEASPGFRSYLPDCRAYELVTPSFKAGFPVVVEAISESGSQLETRSFGVFSNPEDITGLGAVYEVTRAPSGWVSTPVDAPIATFTGFNVEVVSSDFTNSLWVAKTPSEPVISDVYLATLPQGPFASIGPGGPKTVGARVLKLAGASRDFSHSLFFVAAPRSTETSELWPGDKTVGERQPSLYEYAGTDNSEPRLVGVSNAGPVENIAAANLISECGTYLGGRIGNTRNAYNAVSQSGGTIFFTALGHDYGACGALDPSVEPTVNELYARLSASQTVDVSEPSKADCGECDLSSPADAEFQGASQDGSKVFFTTAQHLHLVPDAEGAGDNLYAYDFEGPMGRRVTLVSSGDPAGARVQRVVRVSEDGSHVYFIAQGVFTGHERNAYGAEAQENAQNLYVYERDATYPQGHLAFVAAGEIDTAQATPDGRFLVFESPTDLTPDEEERPERGQVFEYDAQTAMLVRVSKGQQGYNEDGNSNGYAATIPSQEDETDLPINEFTGLAVSGNGAYVFFTSEDALTPQTLDGAANVYEYHEGQVALVSDGHDLVNVLESPAVQLLGTDESGQDVYFRTADRLVPQDTDTQLDVYDARIEGGFPPAGGNLDCSEDSCQGPPTSGLPSPTLPTLSSTGESPVPVASGVAPNVKATPMRPRTKAKIKKKRRKPHPRKAKKATRGSR